MRPDLLKTAKSLALEVPLMLFSPAPMRWSSEFWQTLKMSAAMKAGAREEGPAGSPLKAGSIRSGDPAIA
jgi:hypothetical protein